MKELELDTSLADMFNISSNKYKSDKIKDMPLTVRQRNALIAANCVTVEQLLNMTLRDLYAIKNLGKTSIDGIVEYIARYDVEKIYQIESNLSRKGTREIKKYAGEILAGKFDEINDDKVEPIVLEEYRNAYVEIEHDLLEKCVSEPEKIIPYIDMFLMWVNYRDSVREVLSRIPAHRLINKAIGYINVYINVNREWEYLLPNDFDEDMSLETFFEVERLDSWSEIKKFANWCAINIRDLADELVAEIAKKDRDLQVVKYRKEKKTLEEVGLIFNVTRERIRQIEVKTKRKALSWARRNKIFRLMAADLNYKTVMTAKDFDELLGANGSLIFYLLADNDETKNEGFAYDKVYQVFVLGDDSDFTAEEEFVDNLPVIFSTADYEILTRDAIENNAGISEDQLRLVIENEYQIKDGIYRRKHERVSLTLIYGEVLKRHFDKGIRIHVDKEIEQFKKYVQEDYGIDISQKNNKAIQSIIGRVGIACNRGTICPKHDTYIREELREKLRQYILTKKNPLIFINSIFSVFEYELQNFGIDNRYYLQGVLKEEFSNEFYITRDYISREPVTGTIYTSVVEYIKKFSYPISKEQIFHEFPGLTEIMLNMSTTNDPGVINYFGQYMHIDRVKLLDFDKEYLKKTIAKILSDGKPHHDEEIYEHIHNDNPGLLKRIYISFPYSCFSFLESLYGDEYQFARPYIARNDVEIGNPYEQIKEYVIGEECVDIEDILGFAKELHYQVNSILDFIESFNETHILINSEQIASYNYIGINSSIYEGIETEIAAEINETVPIRELNCLHRLKCLNVPWTEWLLYGLVSRFGSRVETGVSNNQFRFAVPLISPKGKMDCEKYVQLKVNDTETIRMADNLDNIDDLIVDIIGDEIEGDM